MECLGNCLAQGTADDGVTVGLGEGSDREFICYCAYDRSVIDDRKKKTTKWTAQLDQNFISFFPLYSSAKTLTDLPASLLLTKYCINVLGVYNVGRMGAIAVHVSEVAVSMTKRF